MGNIKELDADGSYEVNWTAVAYADTYYLFRSDSDFSNVDGMIPIYSGSDLLYNEIGRPEGDWFYAIIASNGEVNTSLSDTASITVQYPGNAPVIDDISTPNYNGTYQISWTDDGSPTSYKLYCNATDFTDVSSLTPINEDKDGVKHYGFPNPYRKIIPNLLES